MPNGAECQTSHPGSTDPKAQRDWDDEAERALPVFARLIWEVVP